MLRELLALIDDPSRQASRLAVRAGLMVAALGLAWTLLATGVVFAVAGVWWLLPHVGRAGALGCSGASALVIGLFVVLLYGRQSSHAESTPAEQTAGVAAVLEFASELIAGYPLESIARFGRGIVGVVGRSDASRAAAGARAAAADGR